MSSLLLAWRPFDRDNAYTKQKIMPAARAIKMLEMYLRGWDICCLLYTSTDGGWFNGYYDNNGRTVERCESGDVRKMCIRDRYADHMHSRRPTDLQAITMKVSLRQV